MISFTAGGEINTLKMVSQSVINGIPVIIIPDEGATEFIAQGMKYIHVPKYSYLDTSSDPYMSDK